MTTQQTKIKRCLFCGYDDSIPCNDLFNVSMHYVTCLNCLSRGPLKKTKAQAIKAWTKIERKVEQK